MKTLVILLLTASSLYAADVRTVRVDIRIIGTQHVDLSPIHKWIDGGRKGDRPMTHWKLVTIETLQQTAPSWITGYVQIDRQEHKTIYLKNIPKEMSDYLSRVGELEVKKKELANQIESDKKNLAQARAVDADKHSDFAQQRRELNAKLEREEIDFRVLTKQIDDVKLDEKLKASDLAMFTGQTFNKLEVWDFGVRQ